MAEHRLASAQRAFQADLARSRNLEGRPIEVLNSLNLLTAARLDLIQAQVGFNQAQIQLIVATGSPPALTLQRGTTP